MSSISHTLSRISHSEFSSVQFSSVLMLDRFSSVLTYSPTSPAGWCDGGSRPEDQARGSKRTKTVRSSSTSPHVVAWHSSHVWRSGTALVAPGRAGGPEHLDWLGDVNQVGDANQAPTNRDPPSRSSPYCRRGAGGRSVCRAYLPGQKAAAARP